MMMKSLLAVLAVTGLASCQSVQSRHVDFASGQVASGLHYAAPKAVMKVELVASNGVLSLNISQPFLIGDPDATYMLNTSASLFADNRYFFLVNPQTRLLTHVNATSDGKAGKIIASLAKSIGALSGGAGTKGGDESGDPRRNPLANATLYSTIVDPLGDENCKFGGKCELTELNAQLHRRAMVFLGCKADAGDTGQCRELAANPNYFAINIDPLFKLSHQPLAKAEMVSPSACSSSICYRAPAPYLIDVKVGDITDESRLIMMPNKSPIMAIDLPTGVFATARARVDLVHGMPASVGISQDSELLQIVAIPLDIIKGFFQGVGEVFSIRIQYDNSKVALLRAEEARQKAEDAYQAGQVARAAERVRNAEAKLKTVSAGGFTDTELQAAQEELEAAQTAHQASLAALGTALGSSDDPSAETGDESAAVTAFLDGSPGVSSDSDGISASQQAQITVLDEKSNMFSIKVLDSEAGIAARARLKAETDAAAQRGSAATGGQALQPPSSANSPVVDPAEADDQDGEN